VRESESAVKHGLQSFIGVSRAIEAIRGELQDAAQSDAKVLVTGESGVGKEVASRVIHQLSRRAHMPLVAINCVGIPESLLESELFGHVRGSFTGAYRDRAGLLERAHRGTLFLDEVCEMGPRMQALLLRFLETGEIQRVGSDRSIAQLDVRVIAATNRDPLELVRSKTFREDLYYRLNVMEISIPPLRERREDIPILFDHFLQMYSAQTGSPIPTLAPDALNWIVEHDWPGNVRELKNTVERLIVRARGAVVTAAQLAARKDAAASPPQLSAIAAEPPPKSTADVMYDRMVKHRESFWSAVHAAYMVRDLTRSDVRAIITRGLHETAGNYKMLVELFNMDRGDYKRFLNFLRKHKCQLPFADFRAVKPWHREPPDRSFRAHSAAATPVRH
jgi:transcriptional regulator with PAS, ATPase and Fis domain